jgi:type VI protein secretion system component VasF
MEIILGNADIQAIANGRVVKRYLSDGTEIKIRQSYLQDAAAPLINDRFQVKDMVVEEQLQKYRDSMRDSYQLGG